MSNRKLSKIQSIEQGNRIHKVTHPSSIICSISPEDKLRMNWRWYVEKGFGEVEDFLQGLQSQFPMGTVLFTPLFSFASDIFLCSVR